MQALRIRPWLWLLAGLAALLVLPAGPGIEAGGVSKKEEKQRQAASVNGKYSRLLTKFREPKDKDVFTSFCDWGYGEIPNYGNATNLPNGYWVYVAPDWYIWGSKNPYRDRSLETASMNGKYGRLLRKITVPADWKVNGKFKEFGPAQVPEFGGYKNLPSGFWVYAFPHWYIWGDRLQPLPETLLAASMHCKYSRLLKKVRVPEDEEIYQEWHDEGYYVGGAYGGYDNLPAGYWVYLAPYWYIWGDLRPGQYYKKADYAPGQ